MISGEATEIEEDLSLVDIELVSTKKFKISCCRSYMTPKGRCYTCPDDDPLSEE